MGPEQAITSLGQELTTADRQAKLDAAKPAGPHFSSAEVRWLAGSHWVGLLRPGTEK